MVQMDKFEIVYHFKNSFNSDNLHQSYPNYIWVSQAFLLTSPIDNNSIF